MSARYKHAAASLPPSYTYIRVIIRDELKMTIIASGNKRARANLFQNISMAMIRGNIINVKSTVHRGLSFFIGEGVREIQGST